MSEIAYLKVLEAAFMALADKTRLRLLNLMAGDEVCVCFFTEVLGYSQPKISRHLAYLRNADLVEARRDGKWMHYSIKWPDDEGMRSVLRSTLNALADDPEMQRDKARYTNVCCTPELLVQIARTPIDFISVQPDTMAPRRQLAHNELDEFLL
ncbi:MAG: metalloregulator ArsR/SmtB family transcription factor [bacterium]|nr:metalloregulator ArsR/SmtB family transcription factor [bacterium]